MQRLAAEALGEIGDPKAFDALLKFERDDDEYLRSVVRDALKKIKSSDAYKLYRIQQAKKYESLLRYEDAAKIYEEFGMYSSSEPI